MSHADEAHHELLTLCSALGALLELHRATGASGLPKATAELARERGWSAEPVVVPTQQREEAAGGRGVQVPAAPLPAAPARAPSSRVLLEPSLPVAVPATLEERWARLKALEAAVADCTRCALSQTRTHTAFSRGDGSSGVCFVGEGPGAEEDRQGVPFVGPAGQLLDKMIVAMGLKPSEVYVCNVVKCRPPDNRKPSPAEISACRGYLEEQLALMQPKVIVVLGATALEGLFGRSESITRARGNWRLYQGIPVMPTFHPAYLLRVPAAKRDAWQDLQAVVQQLGRTLPGRG